MYNSINLTMYMISVLSGNIPKKAAPVFPVQPHID